MGGCFCWFSHVISNTGLSYHSSSTMTPELVKSFTHAFGTNNTIKTESLQFVEKILSHVTIQVDDQDVFKSKLLVAIEDSHNKNVDGHPIIKLLSNTTLNNCIKVGWLFVEDEHGKGKLKSTRSESSNYLITMLYTIIGCGFNDKYCEVLSIACGSKASKIHKRKEFLRDIARDCIKDVIERVHVEKCSIGTSTASTEPTATANALLPVSKSIHSKPPSVRTNVNDNNHQSFSPLTEKNKNLLSVCRISILSKKLANALTPSK